jgi:DNA-binding response OmpR family regulator
MSRVLIIENDEDLRDMLVAFFEMAGYAVSEAIDGKMGLARLSVDPCDLVVTDIIIPEKEGLETIKELHRDFPTLKVIAISGSGQFQPEHCLKAARILGADRILVKPFRRKEILEAAQELLADSKSSH